MKDTLYKDIMRQVDNAIRQALNEDENDYRFDVYVQGKLVKANLTIEKTDDLCDTLFRKGYSGIEIKKHTL